MLFRSFIPSGEQLVDQLMNECRAEVLTEDKVTSVQDQQP